MLVDADGTVEVWGGSAAPRGVGVAARLVLTTDPESEPVSIGRTLPAKVVWPPPEQRVGAVLLETDDPMPGDPAPVRWGVLTGRGEWQRGTLAGLEVEVNPLAMD